jgi:hypothetical protein
MMRVSFVTGGHLYPAALPGRMDSPPVPADKKTDPFSYPLPGHIYGTIWKTRQEAIDRPEEFNGKPTGK